ncbi:DUF2922 domain-containing protein [Clostridium sp.]|uniref:DUF2922 domain-containing protein n=1 Tax=Clostridium sp. TaxID=1506 RepID=UPI0026DBD43F|nr:DUF2922 domain-containing protein [Clostridium sp.]MDO5039778.1 DUF2922 domain-containing protein [Clostridium sp.]
MIDRILVMGFKNELGKKVNLTIREVRDDLTNTEVNDLMDLIIEKDVFITSGGALSEKVKAEVITKEITEMELVIS